ncbi:hypothetical protein D3C75_523590 [compost metagenome]
MGRQRIYLGDPQRRSHEGRTNGAPGADQITVRVGLFHQSFGNQVVGGEAVADNRLQLLLQPGGDNLGYRLAVHSFGRVITLGADFLLRTFNDGREQTVVRRTAGFGEQLDFLKLVSQRRRILHHYFKCRFLVQEGKFPEHLLGGAQVHIRLALVLQRAETGNAVDGNIPADLVPGMQVMDIAGGNNRLAQLASDVHNPPDRRLQILTAAHQPFFNQMHVHFRRLDFQHIVKQGDVLSFLH